MARLKSTPVHARIPNEWLKRIDAAAAKLNISRSQYLARAAIAAVKDKT